MKFNKLVAAFILATAVSGLAQNNIGTLVTDPVRPFSVNSTHPSAIANEIKGGPFVSSNLAGLSNIPAPRLEIGAIGYATNTGLYYRLTATNPATWSSINGANFTNIAASNVIGALATNGNGAGLTNLTAANITGTVALANGGTGGSNAITARINLGLGTTNSVSFGSVNSTNFNIIEDGAITFFGTNESAKTRTNLSLGFSALTNTNAADFRTAIGLGNISTNTLGTNTSVFVNTNFTATNGAARFTNLVTDYLEFGNNNGNLFIVGTNTNIIAFEEPQARTNFLRGIGLGPTNNVRFGYLGITNTTNTTVASFAGVNGNPLEFITTDEALETGYGSSAYAIGVEPDGVRIKYGASNASWGIPVITDYSGNVVRPTNFWQVAPLVTRFVEFQPNTNATTNVVPARNLHIHSLALSITGVTSTIVLPTNGATFNGDIALVVHQGPTNSTTRVRAAGSTNDLVNMTRFDEAVEFVYYNGVWEFNHNLSFIEPIFFSGTNAAANAASSRTNLGLGNISMGSNGVVVATNFYATNGEANFTNLQTDYLEFNDYLYIETTNTNVVQFFDATVRSNFQRSIGFGPTNDVTFNNITISDSLLTLSSGGEDDVFVRNDSGALELESSSQITAFSPISFNNTTNAATTRTNLGLGATNNVTFSNVTASGTLTATGAITATTNLVVEGFVDFSTNHTNSNPATNNQIQKFLQIRIGTNAFFLPLYK
jgi:hypothetical protein